MSKVKCIGIIAEDNSDFECSKILIQKITGKNHSFKKAIGNGCGKLRRKASAYAIDLQRRGCDMLFVLHYLYRNNFKTLKKDLDDKLKDSPITNKLICIPTEEIEGWFLSDPICLKQIFKLKRIPKIQGKPEQVTSPKEKLEDIVRTHSDNTMVYLNTKHNPVIANSISISLIYNQCPSFKDLHDFVAKQKY